MNGQAEQHWICRLTNQPHQFSHESGVEVTHVEPGRAEGVLTVGPDSINPHGKVHGGALATLADTVAGCCACARGRSCVTSGSSMEFLRPADGGPNHLHSSPKRRGAPCPSFRWSCAMEREALVATGTFTFFMFDWKGLTVPGLGSKRSPRAEAALLLLSARGERFIVSSIRNQCSCGPGGGLPGPSAMRRLSSISSGAVPLSTTVKITWGHSPSPLWQSPAWPDRPPHPGLGGTTPCSPQRYLR